MTAFNFRAGAVRCVFALGVLIGVVAPADAARVAVISNRYSAETAADFNVRIPTHKFTAIDTSTAVPSLKSLIDGFDLVLLYEDQTYANAPAVGNVVAAFANSGRVVVIGSFYDQDRSDATPFNSPNGWGLLETIDPNTTDGIGTPGTPRTLNIATMQRHALTRGLTALGSARYAGGNQAKPGTTVLAYWTELNARQKPDPAIAYRISGAACVIHIAIAPNYPAIGIAGTDYSGDFHRAWKNGFDFAAAGCVGASIDAIGNEATAIPTLSAWSLALTILLLGAVGFTTLRSRRARR